MNNSEIKYNNFFGFSELPFQRELGQKSPFIAKQHEALLTDLVKFIIARQGVALLEGDSGVGKTVLARIIREGDEWSPFKAFFGGVVGCEGGREEAETASR
jgi:type II secretory pathway predicted ATPase ExeA